MIAYFSDFRYVDPFRIYLGENCQKPRRKFDVFALTNVCCGRPFQSVKPHYHACLQARRLEKFRAVISTNPKVIDTNTLNYFKPNFKS